MAGVLNGESQGHHRLEVHKQRRARIQPMPGREARSEATAVSQWQFLSQSSASERGSLCLTLTMYYVCREASGCTAAGYNAILQESITTLAKQYQAVHV